MTKVKCACIECKYINRQGNCSLKQINLSQWGVNTKNIDLKSLINVNDMKLLKK